MGQIGYSIKQSDVESFRSNARLLLWQSLLQFVNFNLKNFIAIFIYFDPFVCHYLGDIDFQNFNVIVLQFIKLLISHLLYFRIAVTVTLSML